MTFVDFKYVSVENTNFTRNNFIHIEKIIIYIYILWFDSVKNKKSINILVKIQKYDKFFQR